MSSKPKIPVGGLATGPNDLDSPPGNFLVADNVVHRRAGILEPLPGDENIETTPQQYSKVFADWEPEYYLKLRKLDADNFAQLMPEMNTTEVYDQATFRPGESQAVYSDGRHILSGAEFVVVVENEGTGHGAPRRAGLPQVAGVVYGPIDLSADAPPVIPANKVVAWTALVRRRITGDRYIYSAPCSKISNIQIGSAGFYTLRVFASNSDGSALVYKAGDEILLFRTTTFDSYEEINDTYFLTAVHMLTSGEVAGTFFSVLIEDRTLDQNLGEELYTNPGQEGALKTNIVPPCVAGVETYNLTTFYPNNRAQSVLTASARGRFGQLPLVVDDNTSQLRRNGIGSRILSGTFTTSSNLITNVSADDRIGLAIGQRISADLFVNPGGTITAITGSGPYTITMSLAAYIGGSSGGIRAIDTATVEAVDHRTGATSVSLPFRIDDLEAFQGNLAGLVDSGSLPMPGFVVNASDVVKRNVVGLEGNATLQVQVTFPSLWDSFQIVFTNPDNWIQGRTDPTFSYLRRMDSVQEIRRNVVWYGKPNQPEHVSPIQFILVGAGTVYRLLNVQSSMMAFCSDGIFKITGEGDTWNVVPIDIKARIVHPDCVVGATTGLAYAWLESGFSVVSEAGCASISQNAIDPELKNITKQLYDLPNGVKTMWGPQMVYDRVNNDVWLNIVRMPEEDVPSFLQCYIFNTQTNKFTTQSTLYTALSYWPKALELLRSSATGMNRNTTLVGDYHVATVVYVPLVDNASMVKQWVNVNYFLDNVPAEEDETVHVIEALFGGELTSTTNVFELDGAEPVRAFALNALVPRRCARDVELVLGFRTTASDTADPTVHPSGGFYFQFKGASVGFRRASSIIKR